MKPIICMGFIFPDLACSFSLDSARGDEDHGGLAAGDRIGHWRGGFDSVARDRPLANGIGEPGRAGADVACIPGRPVVFCGGARLGRATFNPPAPRWSGAGPMSDLVARPSAAPL